MPQPEIIFTPQIIAILVVECLLALAGAIVLTLNARRARAGSPARLTPSPYRLSEICLATAFALGGAAIFSIGAEQLAPRFWPKPPPGETGAFHVALSSAFHLGLLAGLAHAWFWHLRDSRRAPAEPTPPPPLPPLTASAAVLQGFLTFLTLITVLWPVGYFWKYLLDALGVEAPAQDIVSLFLKRDHPGLALVVMFFAVVIAPVVEETIFRIGLFRWLRGRVPRGVALLLPAVVFALLHPYVAVIVPLFIFALMLAFAYERSGHPLTPIVAHSLFNLHTLLLILAGWPA